MKTSPNTILLLLLSFFLSFNMLSAQTPSPQNLAKFSYNKEIKLGPVKNGFSATKLEKVSYGSFDDIATGYLLKEDNMNVFRTPMKKLYLRKYKDHIVQLEFVIGADVLQRPTLDSKKSLEQQKKEHAERLRKAKANPYEKSQKHLNLIKTLTAKYGKTKEMYRPHDLTFVRVWENENYKLEYLYPLKKKLIFTDKKMYAKAKDEMLAPIELLDGDSHIKVSPRQLKHKLNNQPGAELIKFEVQNIGKIPLVIRHVKVINAQEVPDVKVKWASGNIVPKYDREVLMPNDKTVVELTVVKRGTIKPGRKKAFQVLITTSSKTNSINKPHGVFTLLLE